MATSQLQPYSLHFSAKRINGLSDNISDCQLITTSALQTPLVSWTMNTFGLTLELVLVISDQTSPKRSSPHITNGTHTSKNWCDAFDYQPLNLLCIWSHSITQILRTPLAMLMLQ